MNKYDKSHFNEVEKNVKAIQSIMDKAVEEIARLGMIGSFVTPELINLDNLPLLKAEIIKVIQSMKSEMIKEFDYATKKSWLRGEGNNYKVLKDLGLLKKLSEEELQNILDPDFNALKAFQKRKKNGFSLSNRVWNIGQAFYDEMEMALDVSFASGKSAQKIASEVKHLLRNPDEMHKRYRNKNGKLVWSKKVTQNKAKKGVYRSSYKNAFRLARTENNIAYHSAMSEKYNHLDFVVGFEVRLSNNPNHCPFCKTMAGKYPSNFKFVGWHPQCRCTTIPILKSDKEMDRDRDLILNGEEPKGSKNEVKKVPQPFYDYVKENQEKLEKKKVKPYYIYDNKEIIKKIKNNI